MNEEMVAYDVVDRKGNIIKRSNEEILRQEDRALLSFDDAMDAGVMGITVFNTKYGQIKFYTRHETSDAYHIKNVIAKGHMAGEIMKHMDLPAYRYLLEYESTWLDVGAHLGSFAIRMAIQFKHRSIMIEGYEPSLSMGMASVRLNGLEKYVTAHHGAITGYGDTRIVDGEIGFYCMNNTAASNTITPVKGRLIHQAPAVHLPELLDDYDANCVKLDVEGAEYGEFGIIETVGDVWERIDMLLLEYHIFVGGDNDLYFKHMNHLKSYYDDSWVMRQRQVRRHIKDNATFFKRELADKIWYEESFDPSSVMIAD